MYDLLERYYHLLLLELCVYVCIVKKKMMVVVSRFTFRFRNEWSNVLFRDKVVIRYVR